MRLVWHNNLLTFPIVQLKACHLFPGIYYNLLYLLLYFGGNSCFRVHFECLRVTLHVLTVVPNSFDTMIHHMLNKRRPTVCCTISSYLHKRRRKSHGVFACVWQREASGEVNGSVPFICIWDASVSLLRVDNCCNVNNEATPASRFDDPRHSYLC